MQPFLYRYDIYIKFTIPTIGTYDSNTHFHKKRRILIIKVERRVFVSGLNDRPNHFTGPVAVYKRRPSLNVEV
jgi:hypothetical protein